MTDTRLCPTLDNMNMNRIASIAATVALALSALLVASPADATVGTDGLTCAAPVTTQVYVDGHGPYTRVTVGCTDGPAGTTWRAKVRFVDVFGGQYVKTYGWADYGNTGSVTSTRIGDEVMSVVYQWGDVVVPTSKSRVPARSAPIVAR